LIKAIIFDLDNTLIGKGHPLGRITPFPDMLPVLNQLKERYKLALITNVGSKTTVDDVHAVLREAEIFDLFDVIVISSVFGHNKPDERIFHYTLDQLQVQPNEAIMVGNTISTDIFGSNRVGMTSVLFQPKPTYQWSSWEHPDHTVRALRELLTLFQQHASI
jgi:putative hydrolase of the HAD superfamily